MKNAKVTEFLIISPEEKTNERDFKSHKCLKPRGAEARILRCWEWMHCITAEPPHRGGRGSGITRGQGGHMRVAESRLCGEESVQAAWVKVKTLKLRISIHAVLYIKTMSTRQESVQDKHKETALRKLLQGEGVWEGNNKYMLSLC